MRRPILYVSAPTSTEVVGYMPSDKGGWQTFRLRLATVLHFELELAVDDAGSLWGETPDSWCSDTSFWFSRAFVRDSCVLHATVPAPSVRGIVDFDSVCLSMFILTNSDVVADFSDTISSTGVTFGGGSRTAVSSRRLRLELLQCLGNGDLLSVASVNNWPLGCADDCKNGMRLQVWLPQIVSRSSPVSWRHRAAKLMSVHKKLKQGSIHSKFAGAKLCIPELDPLMCFVQRRADSCSLGLCWIFDRDTAIAGMLWCTDACWRKILALVKSIAWFQWHLHTALVFLAWCQKFRASSVNHVLAELISIHIW